MTPWTGHHGEPVPVALRHDFGPGRRCGTCTACGTVWVLVECHDVSLCPVAVAQRLTELEAHGASLHKYGAWVRDEIARYLAAMADEGDDPWMSYCAEAISCGEYVAWCEAHPETSPAPVGADAGRDPGSSEE